MGTSLILSAISKKQFDSYSDEVKSAYVSGLQKLAAAPTGTIPGLTHLYNNERTRSLGATYAYRASKALRILLNRDGANWEVVRFMKRGEKHAPWSSER